MTQIEYNTKLNEAIAIVQELLKHTSDEQYRTVLSNEREKEKVEVRHNISLGKAQAALRNSYYQIKGFQTL